MTDDVCAKCEAGELCLLHGEGPEKRSAWDENAPPVVPPITDEPEMPEWFPAFEPGTLIQHMGWWARIVGLVEGKDGKLAVVAVPLEQTKKQKKRERGH